MKNLSLGQAAILFLRVCSDERALSRHSQKAYAIDLRQFHAFVNGKGVNDLGDVSRKHVGDFLASLSSFKPRSVRRKLATLKSFFSHFEREGMVVHNPTRLIRLSLQMGRRLPRGVSLDCIKKLLAHLRANVRTSQSSRARNRAIRDQALIEMMFLSAMRVGEIANLRIPSVDMENRSVLVHGKGNRERIIPLCSKPAIKIISRYLAQRRGMEDYVFLNRSAKRLSEQSIRNSLRKYARQAGLPHITPHMIRHTTATLLLGRGADLRNIQVLLGHSSIATTTIYAHVSDSVQRSVLDALHPRQLF